MFCFYPHPDDPCYDWLTDWLEREEEEEEDEEIKEDE